jgi:diaminopimelate decarboxylase
VDEFHYEGNELVCESMKVADLAERFGTPLYVYSRRSVISHCRWIEEVFGATEHLSCYAIKANFNRTILSIIAKEGIGADAGSLGEMQLALESGFPARKITFSGVGKGDDEIAFALRHDILAINAESQEEIDIIDDIAAKEGKRARILLRVNLDLPADTHPYITTGRKHNKFGVSSAQAHTILKRASTRPSLEILGVHTHIGSQIISPPILTAAACALVELVHTLRREGIPVRHINFGGGFGVQYRDYVTHPMLPVETENPEADLATVTLLRSILPVLKDEGCTLLIQPGRSIIAHSGILLTKVLYRKETGDKIFIIVDAGMNDLIRPSLYQSYHQVVPALLRGRKREIVDIVGPLCESGDFIALGRTMPRVDRRDTLAIMCTGAYGYVLASNYNGRMRAAEVLVDGNDATVIRARESIRDI